MSELDNYLDDMKDEDKNEFDDIFAKDEAKDVTNGITLSDEQQAAFDTCINSKERIFILTGRPGTGKTTLAFWLLQHYLEETQGSVALCAPTGRAAKRLSEKTGHRATTIHRLLKWQPMGGFKYNETLKLAHKVIVCDESSMIDLFLFNSLLKAIPSNCKLILSGDPYQLPPVGPGAPFRDLINSNVVPCFELMEIHRQAADNRIIATAHAILDGDYEAISWDGERKDFQIIEKTDEEYIVDYIEQEITFAKHKYGVKPNEVQVLTPMHKGLVGTKALNERFQATFNPPLSSKREFISGFNTFREGDRIIQMKNDYELDVFNGDLGIISNIYQGADVKHEGLLQIRFDDREEPVQLENTEQVNRINLAYALTVHKSQGSEYPLVIIPCHSTHTWMWRRPLIYTAVTRAQKYCVLVGDTSVMTKAIQDNRDDERQTYLKQRIRG